MAGIIEKFFVGKRVLITGASRGIGRALLERVHSYGAEVFALSKDSNRLDKLKSDFPSVTIICCDLSSWEATEKKIRNLDALDCVVNNAGLALTSTFWSLSPQLLDKLYAVNVKATFNISRIAAQKMIDNNIKGSIVNITSEVATKPQLRNVGYTLSKASLRMLTKIMAYELAKHGIRVNAVAPGPVCTDMLIEGYDVEFKCGPGEGIKILERTLLKRHRIPTGNVFVSLDDVVNATLFLLTDLSPQLIGEDILIDAGQHLT